MIKLNQYKVAFNKKQNNLQNNKNIIINNNNLTKVKTLIQIIQA